MHSKIQREIKMTKEERLKQKYSIYGSNSLYYIRNRNEVRTINLLPEVLEEYETYNPDIIDIQDIYALTLNLLPPRYTQEMSIVFHEHVTDENIKNALHEAIEKVRANPKGSSQ